MPHTLGSDHPPARTCREREREREGEREGEREHAMRTYTCIVGLGTPPAEVHRETLASLLGCVPTAGMQQATRRRGAKNSQCVPSRAHDSTTSLEYLTNGPAVASTTFALLTNASMLACTHNSAEDAAHSTQHTAPTAHSGLRPPQAKTHTAFA